MAVETAAQIVFDANNMASIINNINGLYDNVITYTLGLLAVVGGVIPFIINRLQQKNFKDEQEILLLNVKNELSKKEIELKVEIKNDLLEDVVSKTNQIKSDLESELQQMKKQLSKVEAGTFHVQANQQTNPAHVPTSCLHAINGYIAGDDERNVRSIIHILETNVTKLNASHLESIAEPFTKFEEIIETLENNNVNGRYSLDISRFKANLKLAKSREAPKATVSK